MNISRKSAVAVLAAATLALGAGAANAGGGWGGGGRGGCGAWSGCGGGCGGGGGWGGGWNGYDQERSQEIFMDRMAARHERLKEALKIEPNQEAAWKNFTDQMAELAQERFDRPDPGSFADLSMPERMAKRQEQARQRQALMEKRLAAVKTFYATLTEKQQKKFDDWHSPRRWR